MKKLIVIGATALVAMFVLVGYAPAASAYPETTCNTTVDAQTVVSDGKIHVHGTVEQTTTDDGLGRRAASTVHWVATFNGETHTADENVFNTTFDVPTVTKKTTFTLHVEAIMPDEKTTCQRTLEITVQPTSVSPPGGPHLPNTGGPRLILLIAGLGLVIVGAGAIRLSRKERQTLGRHAH